MITKFSFSSMLRRFSKRQLAWILASIVPAFITILFVLHIYLNYYEEVAKDKSFYFASDNTYDITERTLFRIRRYCNFVEDIKLQDETSFDEVKVNLTLNKIIILIRHGDRGPLRKVKHLSELPCDIANWNPGMNSGEPYLTLAKQLILSTSDYTKWNPSLGNFTTLPPSTCQLGELTQVGLLQHIKLGHLLSSHYSHKLSLTNATLPYHLEAITTPYNRTFQSAIAFLFGFFKNLDVDFDEAKPHLTSCHDVYFCGLNQSSVHCQTNQCPAIVALHDKLRSSGMFGTEMPVLDGLADDFRKILSPSLNDTAQFRSVVSLFDGVSAYVCHQEKLPCDSNFGCLTSSKMAQLISYLDYLGKRLIDSPEYHQLGWLHIYGFLNRVIDIVSQTNLDKKLFLFSAHDITIEALMAALRLYDGHIPQYASRVIFEIYSDVNGEKFLRFIYNGKDITRFFDSCKKGKCSIYDSSSLVKVVDFKSFVLQRFANVTTTSDYLEACQLIPSTCSKSEGENHDSRL